MTPFGGGSEVAPAWMTCASAPNSSEFPPIRARPPGCFRQHEPTLTLQHRSANVTLRWQWRLPTMPHAEHWPLYSKRKVCAQPVKGGTSRTGIRIPGLGAAAVDYRG